MSQPQVLELLNRVQALARHESAHWLAAVSLGFDAQEIRLDIESPEAHRGKAHTNVRARCETLEELQVVMRQRALVLLAGAMGEALNVSTRQIDAGAAQKILDEGATGAGQDYAVAKELTVLLHGSMPVRESFTSRDLLIELQADAFTLVSLHAAAVADLASAFAGRVIAGKGRAVMQRDEIAQLPLFCDVPYAWAQYAIS
ncbi:hypothetical protein [Pseudomonas sp.]|uniref:hypothetical protein n=1 Tax=Pseudomonas sp. TaxID=306 RepID=UPI00291193C8|nr:hypothetical protein [Pseudomonas sp.]MDU4254504.1 hypothetical protein [Pseudomonas sp.]